MKKTVKLILLAVSALCLTGCTKNVAPSKLPKMQKQPQTMIAPERPLPKNPAYNVKKPTKADLDNRTPAKQIYGVPQNLRAFSALDYTWGGNVMISEWFNIPKKGYYSYDLTGVFTADPAYIKGKVIERHAKNEALVDMGTKKTYKIIMTSNATYIKQNNHWQKERSDIFNTNDLNAPFEFAENLPYSAKYLKQYDCVDFEPEPNVDDLNKYCRPMLDHYNIPNNNPLIKPYISSLKFKEGRAEIKTTWKRRYMFSAMTNYAMTGKDGFKETRVVALDQLVNKVANRRELQDASKYN